MSESSSVACIIDQTVGILQSFSPELIQSVLGWQLPLLKAIFNSVLKLSYSVLSTYYGASALATTNKLSLGVFSGD